MIEDCERCGGEEPKYREEFGECLCDDCDSHLWAKIERWAEGMER